MKAIVTLIILLALTACRTTNTEHNMTVTLIDEDIAIKDTNIIETVPLFSIMDRNFEKGQQVVSGNFVYQRVGEDISVPQFDSDKTYYSINDLVFTDKLAYVSKTIGTQLVAIQPELYANDTSIESNSWQNRYFKIGAFSNGKIEETIVNGEDTYNYTFLNNAGVIAITIQKESVSETSEQYINSNNYTNIFTILGTIGSSGYLYSRNSNGITTLYKLTSNLQLNTYYVKDGYEYKAVTDENNYAREDYGTTDWNNLSANDVLNTTLIHHYSIVQKTVASTSFLTTTEATYQSSLGIAEEKAIVIDNYLFTPKYFIIRADDLYMRTNVNTEQETETVDIVDVELLPILSPSTINWGWAILRPTMKYALLDSEKNTKMKSTTNVFFDLISSVQFDAIVLNAIIGSKIKVTIGTKVIERTPKNILTMNEKSIVAHAKTILYLDEMYPANTLLKIEIETLNGVVEIGGVYIGEKFDIGYTDIPFTKKHEPIDTLSYDDFGNVTFINRAVVKKYSTTVKFESKHFNFVDLFMERLAGGKKAVFDGSDNLHNIDDDTALTKSSTIMAGRVTSISISFLAKNRREDDYSVMKIEIREDV